MTNQGEFVKNTIESTIDNDNGIMMIMAMKMTMTIVMLIMLTKAITAMHGSSLSDMHERLVLSCGKVTQIRDFQ